ncbi:hypothetical protein [Planosporangium mesophilum]|uniref:hypothetical protein n=1 Tax=Planosporangium mesophilum TaxID=689768 RepID=UPI0014387BAB|nr:hypothetical protein [Planosporangium mesophilum]NJC86637.1 hypothetical protein [Planosporangium mesophilum]
MRRFVTLVVTAGLLFSAGPAPARAQPSPSPGTAATPGATPAETVCEFDARTAELSGLVATGSGYVAVNDSNDDPAAIRVFFFDRGCRLTRTVGYPSTARDPEDLAVAPDGTLWVADIGDNLTNAAADRRRTVALWKLPPGARTPVIHRLTYPDGPHDAEALVLDGAGTPVIVTKEPFGAAGIYAPNGALQPDTATGTPLRRAGTFTPRRTGTPNFLGSAGEAMVTGGANAPDGARVALRTYADAYEWDVPDGDVVKAITTGTPRVTPLPEEPQGESIAYSRDGTSLLTVSDQSGPAPLLRYPATRPGPAARPTAGPTAPGAAAATRSGAAAAPRSPAQARYLIGAAGALGLALVAAGVVAIGRSRRSRRGSPAP